VKRVARLPLVPGYSFCRPLLFDTDHDGLGEVIHFGINPVRFQIAEYAPVNRYSLVLSDTGYYPWPETVLLGNFEPYDVGDVDRDGRTDIVGQAGYYDSTGPRVALCVFESRDSFSYPDSLVWWTATPNYFTSFFPAQWGNLDGDSAWDIVTPWGDSSTAVFENVGGDRESLVCTVPGARYFSPPTIDDYDRNGRMEYTFQWYHQDFVVECTGDNSYAIACSLRTGFSTVRDRFPGHDVDRNGRPEYFEVSATNLGGLRYLQTLCQFEAPAEHQYICDTVDTASSINAMVVGQSLCTDVDGDGLEEIVWSCGYRILILEATGPHQYEKVCDWRLPQSDGYTSACNAADFNGNGYREIYVCGDPNSFVLEVECIRVLNPDTNRYLRTGDTCEIRWRVITPPRCDSVSLFLRTDTSTVNGFYRLDAIAQGLSSSESTYSWVVPDTTLDSARILAIAYGPGWQFDESDSAFRIAPSGVPGPRATLPREWALSVSPNPARTAITVCYDVPRQGRVSVGVYDVDGRLVEALAEGATAAGRYRARLSAHIPAGVYFCRLGSGTMNISHKVVLTD
jgi:hypothetical protein